jgi:uncharacterized protein with von Willebrand factor type A (vWA) domain
VRGDFPVFPAIAIEYIGEELGQPIHGMDLMDALRWHVAPRAALRRRGRGGAKPGAYGAQLTTCGRGGLSVSPSYDAVRRRPYHTCLSRHQILHAVDEHDEESGGMGEGTPTDSSSLPEEARPPKTDSLVKILNQKEVPDASIAKQMGISSELFESVMDLPGTTNVRTMRSRLLSLARWNTKLSKGSLPKAEELTWPEEPFRSKFLETLRKLGMARFTQKHPKLLGSLMKQFMQLARDFEIEAMQNQDVADDQSKSSNSERPPPSSSSSDPPEEQENQEGGGPSQGDESMEGEDGEGKERDPDQVDVDMQEASSGENMADDDENQDSAGGDFAEALAEKMLEKFEEEWSPALDALEAAEEAFDDLDPLMDGTEGFDAAQAVWHHTGWKQLASLRKKLENLKELRDLVRSLGRGGGKGPLRRAPQQLYMTGMPQGVIRSEESPEETKGLTRSGDLSRMLPIEARLLASGKIKSDKQASSISRRLFMARRAERMLLSYERAGWVEDQPSKVTDRLELRPASEMGPIIVCLDTSASMLGPRETVAKSLTLECMRGAIRQQRKCIVYAFSGPENVMELELGIDSDSITELLSFLTMSFSGGTDVDAPLALSLERLGREEWNMADILMVTDGEIPPPNEDILLKLDAAKEELGLSVHGLLVGQRVTEPMEQICSDGCLHAFKSWNVVDASASALS